MTLRTEKTTLPTGWLGRIMHNSPKPTSRTTSKSKETLPKNPDGIASPPQWGKTMVPPRIQTHLRRQTRLPRKHRNQDTQTIPKFHGHLRKPKDTGWTSEHLNFIVVSKSINEEAMDQNLDKISENAQHTKTETTTNHSQTTHWHPTPKKHVTDHTPQPREDACLVTYPRELPLAWFHLLQNVNSTSDSIYCKTVKKIIDYKTRSLRDF